jgi:protease-4
VPSGDATNPNPRVPREWEGELAVRPFGSDRVEAAIAGRLEQGLRRSVRPRARLAVRLRRGLTLFGEVDTARDQQTGPAPDGRTRPPVTWTALAGLTVDLGRLAVSGAGVAIPSEVADGSDDVGTGGSFVIKANPARRPPAIPLPYVERVKMRGLESDGSFLQMVLRLRRLADDPSVGAVLLDIEGLSVGLGRIEELRSLVEALRRRKPVFAQVSSPNTREYYLASACDRIAIHPAGQVTVAGLAQTVTFYKGALDRLGVKVELVRIAEYKGAMEPFVMTEQSEPVRQNRNAVLDEQYSRIVEGIARGRAARGLKVESIPALVDRAMFAPAEAHKQGLVDVVADEKDVEPFIAESMGRRMAVQDGSGGRMETRLWSPARVGVVLVDGAIVDAEGGLPLSTGALAFADRIVDAIDALKGDGSVRAVVLRVNSPGGSAFGSDRMARAVARLRRSGKPVIVSMGDVAASGGYYVSAPSDQIFASPSTVTGSIGIFGYKVDLQTLLGRVGLASEVYKRGAHADLYSMYRPWTDNERLIVRDHIRNMYYLFLDTVAAGRRSRGITAERADELGRGRIFTGTQAREVRLVDRIGGVIEAIEEAARLGGVPLGPGGVPELVVLPRPTPSPLDTLMRLGGIESDAPDRAHAPAIERSLGAAIRLLAPFLAGSGTGIEARLPYDIETR